MQKLKFHNPKEIEEHYSAQLLAGYRLPEEGKGSALNENKKSYCEYFTKQYSRFKQDMTEAYSSGVFNRLILGHYTAWIDAWMHLTWKQVLAEKREVLAACEVNGQEQLRYYIGDLAQKHKKLNEIEQLVERLKHEKTFIDSGESVYYENYLTDIKQIISNTEAEILVLKEILPTIAKENYQESDLLAVLTIFSRGSYARGELTFSSDIDIGYCFQPQNVKKDLLRTGQELVKRFQELLSCLSINIASQYFESGENLNRFTHTNNLHTIPSILESRSILGNSELLTDLKKQFLAICPKEKTIRYLKTQIDRLERTPNDIFSIKMGYGGIRHLQLALWMVVVIFEVNASNTWEILLFLRENDWISSIDVQSAAQSLAFYLELRNFTELCRVSPHEKEKENSSVTKDRLDDKFCSDFLQLGRKFADIDAMDRYRMYSTVSVSKIAKSIIRLVDTQTIRKQLSGLCLIKQLGANRIIQFDNAKEKLAWNIQRSGVESLKRNDITGIQDGLTFFHNRANLFELFLYIAKTGSILSQTIRDNFSLLVPQLEKQESETNKSEYRAFIFHLFVSKRASTAIRQMVEIAAPPDVNGKIKTLLGIFLPPVNDMRFLLRNIAVHQYPLCVHSVKALEQLEYEIKRVAKSEPELWKFLNDNALFALKWATFFHDIGKIDPKADHEKFGPQLSGCLLKSLGWKRNSEVQEISRFLIRNHQSLVRYSQLAAFPDQGIIKLFEIALRDPGKVLLLYLINIADYKSVNNDHKRDTANLERFFKKTIQIFEAFKGSHEELTLDAVVSRFLNQKIEKTRSAVLYELLLRQCCQRNLEDVIIAPLQNSAPNEINKLLTVRSKLEQSVAFLKRAELNKPFLTKYRQLFFQNIKNIFSEEQLTSLVSPLGENWNWFFCATPNRYLLSSTTEVLTVQLLQFARFRTQKIAFSLVKGSHSEYDTLLFCCLEDVSIQKKIAYALGWRGISIENGKINTIHYLNGKIGTVGFFQISYSHDYQESTHVDLETIIADLQTPKLKSSTKSKTEPYPVQIRFFAEQEKGYLVRETCRNRFERLKTNFVGVRISLTDTEFCYFKLMSAFEKWGVVPKQITITTTGDQIIDYFYLDLEERDILQQNDFINIVSNIMNSEIAI